MSDYQKLVFEEIKRGLINRQKFSSEEMQFLVRTEKLLHGFLTSLKSLESGKTIYSLQTSSVDIFIKSHLVAGIQNGTMSRYPLGWGDSVVKYDTEYNLPKNNSLNFWSECRFSVVLTEFTTFPMFEFSSLAHYITFICSLLIESYEMAEEVLKDANICKDLLDQLVNNNEIKSKEPLLQFYLFKGNSLKTRNKEILSDLNLTQGNTIISNTYSILDKVIRKENYFGEMLTAQRDARKRLGLT